jgi:hypothetical protein
MTESDMNKSSWQKPAWIVSWDQRFDRPVVLPDGKTLRTLEDARQYILALPKSEHETTAWQVAIEALLVAADSRSQRDEKINPPA